MPGGRFDVPGYVERLALVAAIAGPLLLYAFTAPRTVVLEDDGWFLIVGKFLGVGHPPGYPVHTLVSNLFLKIPWGSTAYLGHLLSGIFGALACGAVYVCARLLGAGAVFALIGALLFGVSEHFWAQAIITEVYTLNALFFFGIFALLLYLRRNPGEGRAWTAAAFLYGLSLANHWPLMVLASPGLLLAVVPVWRDVLARWGRLAGTFLLGVVPPYAWMVWRSLQEPQFSFGGPLSTVGDVISHISRRDYAEVDVSPSAGWIDRFEFLQWLGNEFVWQLTLPGFLIALVGVGSLLAIHRWRTAGSAQIDDVLDWAGRCAGPVAFIGSSVVLVWQLSFDFDFYRVQLFRPYSLICYGLLGVWVAMGLTYAMSLAGQRLPWPALRRPSLVLGVAAAVGLALVAWSLSAHWGVNSRASDDFAKRYADMVFEVLPPDAVLVVHKDNITFPTGYYHFVEGQRPDVRVAHRYGYLFPDNLYPPDTHVTREMQQETLRNFIGTSGRPVFQTYYGTADHGRKLRDYGYLREVLKVEYDSSTEIVAHPAAEQFFVSLFEREYRHGWDINIRNIFVTQYSSWRMEAALLNGPDWLVRTDSLRKFALQDYYGLIGMGAALATSDNYEHLDQAMEWLKMAEPLIGAATAKQHESELYTNMGTVRWNQGRVDDAISFFEKSFDIWPHPDNLAAQFVNGQTR